MVETFVRAVTLGSNDARIHGVMEWWRDPRCVDGRGGRRKDLSHLSPDEEDEGDEDDRSNNLMMTWNG